MTFDNLIDSIKQDFLMFAALYKDKQQSYDTNVKIKTVNDLN